MVASSPTRFLNTLIVAVALLAGVGVAAGVATAPSATLDALVERSHLASFYPAALPVGVTARTVLALLAGGAVAAVGFALSLAMRPRRVVRRGEIVAAPDGDRVALLPPVVRRADAHSDAPPRRPIRASSELGAPLPVASDANARPITEPPSVPEPANVANIAHSEAAVLEIPAGPPPIAELPADLNQPLAAFDPGAIPAEPREPVRALPPLVRLEPVAEPAVPAPEPIVVAPEDEDHGEETISDLLARLERGRLARRRAMAVPPPPVPAAAESLDDTLQRLRQLAAR